MPGIGTVGSLIAGGVLGLGLLWLIWQKLAQGEASKIEAASNKNMLQAKLMAEAAEKAARAEVERIEAEAKKRRETNDPADW